MKFDIYHYLPRLKEENLYLGVNTRSVALPYIKQ